MKKSTTVIAIATIALSTSAHAALIDRGNGMIYDSDQNITWLQDANYAMTSGYDADGLMTWAAANTWANNLVYGGYGDWRLTNVDQNCIGKDCTGSELGHLYYVDFGLTWGQSVLSGTDADLDLFNISQAFGYWSPSEYESNTDNAWLFSTASGQQGSSNKQNEFYAWAVRDGDVALNRDAVPVPVPAPAPVLLFGAGILGMMAAKRRRS
ncbi:MAG: DUF1566 domain-containing protein [Gammaproteobacteria bacterium]|nr:DUF1566 domain-containing protein [Gammaproteobacteria bacterium]